MKFLVVSEPLAGIPPPGDPLALFQAAKEHLNAALANGILDCVYILRSGGGCCIVNVETHQELQERVDSFPGSEYHEHRFYRLLDCYYFYDTLIGWVQTRERAGTPVVQAG